MMIGRAKDARHVSLGEPILVGAMPIQRAHGVQIGLRCVVALRRAVHGHDLHRRAELRRKGGPVDAAVALAVTDMVGQQHAFQALCPVVAQLCAHLFQRSRPHNVAACFPKIDIVIAIAKAVPLKSVKGDKIARLVVCFHDLGETLPLLGRARKATLMIIHHRRKARRALRNIRPVGVNRDAGEVQLQPCVLKGVFDGAMAVPDIAVAVNVSPEGAQFSIGSQHLWVNFLL